MHAVELAVYFAAERQGALVLVALGLLSLGAAVCLWIGRGALWVMAWPLAIFGLFQLIVGVAVARRTPAQVARIEQGLRTSREETLVAERARMATVNRNFRIVKRVEAACVVTGLALAVLLPQPGIWASVGLGILVEAAVLLVFDAFAHQRALIYTQWLHGL